MPEPRRWRVGVISDTHRLVRPEALAALRGSDRIVHAGDIVDPAILSSLAQIAPVTAVRGNNDRGPWADALPETDVLVLGAARIFVIHDIAQIRTDPRAAGCNVWIAGHSHKPVVEQREGVLVVNPGSAGPRRFKLPVTVARLTIDGAELRAAIVHLDQTSSV
jgi:putative phosphoesterase